MVGFTRSKLVAVEKRENGIYLAHGILDDHVYTLEVHIEVKVPELVIKSAQGIMKRITTPDCVKAPSILDGTVGLDIRGEEFRSQIKKLVGRGGCRHLADLFLECCNAIVPSVIQTKWKDARKEGISRDDFLKDLLTNEPLVKDMCAAYSKDSTLSKRLGVAL
ncbi:MAG: DUF2889 domain-containing protein [Spirochaetota bacterium]|nr:DUF2889 domain-containing protein [Thermodesulfobacteriota bacterium]MDY6968584.1 DUF2889 domain-containing protein [Spirochaetota bacterium]